MIPRTIHRIWLGGEEPEWTKGFAGTWDLPGWEVRQWGEYDVEEYLWPLENQSAYDNASEIAPGHEGQLRSDLLRYEILYRFGGVYVDHDFECLKDISPLIENAECFAAWETQGEWVANGLMGSTAGYPFLERLILGIPGQVHRSQGEGWRPNKITGPQYLTQEWLTSEDGELMILPQTLIFPYNWREIRRNGPGQDWGDAYTVHHWHNMRLMRGIPVD